MKKITNKNFMRFCNIIKRSLPNPSDYEKCLSDMEKASEDNSGVYVYNCTDYSDLNMEVIKLDEYTTFFNIKRHEENPKLKVSHQPSAVDAVCVNKDNDWFLIEFKNQPLTEAVKSTPKKMLSSLWLIAFLYSKLSEEISDKSDILKFARENVTFIIVVSSDKNEKYDEAIGASWKKEGPFYTPSEFQKYIGYYFKNVYVLTEKGLRFFVRGFE